MCIFVCIHAPYVCDHVLHVTLILRALLVVQENNTDGAANCCICNKATEEDGKFRKFSDKTWSAAKKAAALRNILNSDIYLGVTQLLVQSDQDSTSHYHPSCYRSYTADERPKKFGAPDDEPAPKKTTIKTRRCGVLPKSDKQCLLKGSCIFCDKSSKKKKW